jgi:predicted O-methyltransferase YrrM
MVQSLRRVPGARLVARRLRAWWEQTRPFPRPRYRAGVPRKGERGNAWDPYLPPNPSTLAEAAMSEEAVCFVSEHIDKLTATERLTGQLAYYRYGREKFGRYWRYADLTTLLWAVATLTKPANYLEIGMHRGRSASIVGALCPACEIYGFDLWIPDYAGIESPGPDFVRTQLKAVGHGGNVTLTSGNSKTTVPAFLREHPDLYFDLINVDGDHGLVGAAHDLANVLPRLKIGGVVVFDDLCMNQGLVRLWDRVVKRDSRYVTWEFTETGFGVALAVRIGDEARYR